MYGLRPLLTHLMREYGTDSDRIYLMGMSNGASFVQLLATARNHQIAAIVAHSGARLPNLPAGDGSVPVMPWPCGRLGRDEYAGRRGTVSTRRPYR